jgi:predicted nucleic acid-binding protein
MEAYAVLTRMPSPYRLSGPDALTLLEVNFVRGRRLVALGPSSHLDVVRRAARDVVVGGRVYDALIGECAVSARVKTILTFNEDHFVSFRDRGLEVVVPSGRTRS